MHSEWSGVEVGSICWNVWIFYLWKGKEGEAGGDENDEEKGEKTEKIGGAARGSAPSDDGHWAA